MVSSQIQRLESVKTLRGSVEEALSAAIVLGEFEPGTIITVPTLAARFGVSATPVREAMLEMMTRGFVTPVRNKGYRVTEVSEKSVNDLLQVRRWLESPAMVPLAEIFHEVSVEPFRELVEETLAAARRDDFPEFLAKDTEFHLGLLELLGNEHLVQVAGDLRRHTRMVGLVSVYNSPEVEKSTMEHHLLLDYLVEGRGQEASDLMYHHIGHISGLWANRRGDEAAASSSEGAAGAAPEVAAKA